MLQETTLDFKLVQRICLLQQALDQAMDSLADLQKRVEKPPKCLSLIWLKQRNIPMLNKK